MSEHDEQVALTRWVDTMVSQMPELEMFYAIPNGGHRHIGTARKMKAEGVRAGVWDISLDVPKKEYHGLKGEMKFGKNKLTLDQERWAKKYREYGYYTIVAYDWAQMARAICEYLGYNPDECGIELRITK